MQRRKKLGGIVDRRFGENDPTMTPEQRALERFVKEKQRGNKKSSIFDLEDNDQDSNLTHAGKALAFDHTRLTDDFDEGNMDNLDDGEGDDFLNERPPKRRRLPNAGSSNDGGLDEEGGVQPERPKNKKDVMEELIAKSKLHKYERQQAKEDDDDLRAELDKGLPDLFALLHQSHQSLPQPEKSVTPNGTMNPDRLALLNGKDRVQADKEYDERLCQMTMDQRAKPTVRTLTDEERLHQGAQKLKELESQRLRRMQGESDESETDVLPNPVNGTGDEDPHGTDKFGLGSGLPDIKLGHDIGVEDEDDFVIEEDLVANTSDLEAIDTSESEQTDGSSNGDDQEGEFVKGLISKNDYDREGLGISKDEQGHPKTGGPRLDLAYTYGCPQSHEELLSATQRVSVEDLPTVVQRIRALYHPKLASENKEKLGIFASVLVHHLSYLVNLEARPPFASLEALIRHIHSLAKLHPEHVGRAFRSQLKMIQEKRPTNFNLGDTVILTAIGTIFPTSDNFHQVVTPAMLCMTRYLSQYLPETLKDLAKGTYIITLCMQYQQLSRRYVPEIINYSLNAIWALAPVESKHRKGAFPHYTLPDSLRLRDHLDETIVRRRLTIFDIVSSSTCASDDEQSVKVALIRTHFALIENMATIWTEHSAFCEVFDPIYTALRFLSSKACISKLDSLTQETLRNTSAAVHNQLKKSLATRKPLRLHNHRPRAIKTSIPKFEESYNPDKHYDPDRDRAEASKLKAEHKRERKGALRELRKDANFIARESLREKKERDSAYEKKYKRLVAEIQGEEGREAKSYEREKRMRKGRK